MLYYVKPKRDLYKVTPWKDAHSEYIDKVKLYGDASERADYYITITAYTGMPKCEEKEDNVYYESIIVAALSEVVISGAVFDNRTEFNRTDIDIAIAGIVKSYLTDENQSSLFRYDFASHAVSDYIKSKYGKISYAMNSDLINDLEKAYVMNYDNILTLSGLGMRAGASLFASSGISRVDFGSKFQREFMISILGLVCRIQYNTNRVVLDIGEIFNVNSDHSRSIGFITMVKIIVAKIRTQK